MASKPLGSSLTAAGHASEWFGSLMFETAEASGVKVSEARVRIYAADLADLPPQQVIDAVRRVRREGSGFFPSVAEIRRQVVASPDDQALLAWSALEQAAIKVGAYQSIEIDDAVAAAALVAVFGSWPDWCAQEMGPELLTKRQQFLAAYRDRRRSQQATASSLGAALTAAGVAPPTRLAGLLEASGRYERQPAVVVGRITARGEVLSVREQADGTERRQLPPKEDGDGEEDR